MRGTKRLEIMKSRYLRGGLPAVDVLTGIYCSAAREALRLAVDELTIR
jgi:hypothetical protein